MKAAILLSSYNGQSFIETQIDSILAQQCKIPFDLWVRDDGSTDGTHQILHRYAEAGKLQWYTGENLGCAKSFMDLIRHCPNYDFYAFADQDDYWLPDKLQSGISALENTESPAVYFANAQLVDKDLQSLGRNVYKRSPRLDFCTLSCAGGILGCTMVFNRALAEYIQNAPAPQQLPMHDFYVCLLCLALDGKIFCDENAYIQYRQHGNNVVGVASGLVGTVKSRIKDITKKAKVGIDQQAAQILTLYENGITPDKKDWLQTISRYNRSVFSRLALACTRKTRYVNRNMAIKLRLSILLGNR